MLPASLEERQASLLGEALLCGLLGKALYQELDQPWLEALIRDEVFAEAPFGAEQAEVKQGLALLQQWSARNRGGISAQEMKALENDRLHLLLGMGKVLAAPWESVYFNQQRLVFQKQTLQVREWYARYNLQAERINREPDDHIGLELIFVSQLATRAAQAIEQGEPQAADELLRAEGQFLSEHLLRWGPAFGRLVVQHAETDFYRGLGHLLRGALVALAAAHDVKMPKELSL